MVTPITTWGAFLRKLPFSILVQPLFMVVAVYVFSLRLSHRSDVAIAAVVIAHQTVVVLQFAAGVGPGTLAAVVVVAGVDGLAGAVSYHRYGIAGPLALAAAAFARHLNGLLLS
jgi:hypothetical protein